MAVDPVRERRRAPRVPVAPGEVCRFTLRTRVRLVDISLGGALLTSETCLPPGITAQLRTGLAAVPFSPEIRVQRAVDGAEGQGQVGMGTLFVDMDDQSRKCLEEFLRKASE